MTIMTLKNEVCYMPKIRRKQVKVHEMTEYYLKDYLNFTLENKYKGKTVDRSEVTRSRSTYLI